MQSLCSYGTEKQNALGTLPEMKQLLYTTGVNEVIFCINGLSYTDVFTQMQHCGSGYEYKIHLPGSRSFIGSNSSSTSGDLYTIDRRFHLSDFAHLRNKRMVDIGASLVFLLTFPLAFLAVKRPGSFFGNCFSVLFGGKTWVGYADVPVPHLPPIRRGVLAPYNILPDYNPTPQVKAHLNTDYARDYTPMSDVSILLRNFRYLGGK